MVVIDWCEHGDIDGDDHIDWIPIGKGSVQVDGIQLSAYGYKWVIIEVRVQFSIMR